MGPGWRGERDGVVHTVPVLTVARTTAALLVAGALLAGAACSSEDGRALPPPDPSTTTSTEPPELGSTPSSGQGAVEEPALFSSAFADGEVLPARYTCAGEDVSPPLDWVGAAGAAELAIVVRDRDAGGFVHWVVTGIDPAVHGFAEGGLPESAVQATNGFGEVGWRGPCPPAGEVHTYELVLHLLPEPLITEPGAPGDEVATMVEGASARRAALTVTAAG